MGMVVCAHTAEGLAGEMELLEELTGTLGSMEKQHVVMYVSEPGLQRPTARVLAEGANVEKACDSECMAVVYAVEAAIILLIVLVAIICGMTCHHMLDAPTKFEEPKQG